MVEGETREVRLYALMFVRFRNPSDDLVVLVRPEGSTDWVPPGGIGLPVDESARDAISRTVSEQVGVARPKIFPTPMTEFSAVPKKADVYAPVSPEELKEAKPTPKGMVFLRCEVQELPVLKSGPGIAEVKAFPLSDLPKNIVPGVADAIKEIYPKWGIASPYTVAAMIFHESNGETWVVLGQRRRPPYADLDPETGKPWETLPGGFRKPLETSEFALFREVDEETKLRVEIVKPVGVYTGPSLDNDRKIIARDYGNTVSTVYLNRLSPLEKKEVDAVIREAFMAKEFRELISGPLPDPDGIPIGKAGDDFKTVSLLRMPKIPADVFYLPPAERAKALRDAVHDALPPIGFDQLEAIADALVVQFSETKLVELQTQKILRAFKDVAVTDEQKRIIGKAVEETRGIASFHGGDINAALERQKNGLPPSPTTPAYSPEKKKVKQK